MCVIMETHHNAVPTVCLDVNIWGNDAFQQLVHTHCYMTAMKDANEVRFRFLVDSQSLLQIYEPGMLKVVKGVVAVKVGN